MDKLKTPVLLIVFNRPEQTRQVLETLKQSKPQKLYIAADGPRVGNKSDINKLEQVNTIIKNISWDCEVKKNFSDTNLGCRTRISSAIDWIFQSEEQAIILEDDIIADPSFFNFCQEMLQKYKDNDQISMVSGVNILDGEFKFDSSYFFTKFGGIWGWATWRRSWKDYDVEMQEWKEHKERGNLFKEFLTTKEWNAFNDKWKWLWRENIQTWDYQWDFARFKSSSLSIVPSKNLIRNIGFGEQSTHTKQKDHEYSNLRTYSISWPIRHPKSISVNPDYEKRYVEKVLHESLFVRLKKKVKDLIFGFNN
ncbi:MAG: hemolytic protein HlpA-like protein [Halobacteriovorax sp.]|nr:hemolytic protein HlpA-like protein [Halobacteriovorax sp.]